MKKLQQIIDRKDYERMTEKLRNHTEEFAEIVRRKMRELGLTDEYEPSKGIVITLKEGKTRVGYYSYLAFVKDGICYCLDGRFDGYIHGDFNHYAKAANNAMCLLFLNAARNILEWLSNIETEKTEEIEQAVSDYENINQERI